MKTIIISAIILLSSFQLFAQSDADKVEQYAEVVATPRLLSSKVTIDIDYGEERSIWKDNRIKTDEGKLKKFNTVVDALNYMGKEGWKLVNAFPYISGNGNTQVYHYVFRKSFSKSEVTQ
ncbi:MAG TPA: DUF4177 domain-containing protein [Chitinophagaceae bacterium]